MTGALLTDSRSQEGRVSAFGLASGSARRAKKDIYVANDGKHYWNAWTRNYQRERDGYCIHASCEEDRTGRMLCGVTSSNGGGESFPKDGKPSCRRCMAIMQKRGIFSPPNMH